MEIVSERVGRGSGWYVLWALGAVVGCQERPVASVCVQARGQWAGERVEGVAPELEGAMRAAIEAEHWTVSEGALVRRGLSTETLRVRSESSGQCRVVLDKQGTQRELVLELTADGHLRAIGVGPRNAQGRPTYGAGVILRRLGR
ncbi:MAG: hypothetical protein Q8Q09_16820 [Deltaproteobacteria bacterium]|nr:hypothetical protein [Deltaproteobacteria bacterium]